MENTFLSSGKSQPSGAEKITSALYKVLDFLPESDPLKNRAKEKALSILENLMLTRGVEWWVSLKSYLSQANQEAAVQLVYDIEILEKYLVIGRDQGWIDNVNFLIITKEYRLIKYGVSLPPKNIAKSLEIILESKQENPSKINTIPEPISKINKVVAAKQYTPRQEKILQVLQKNQKAQVSDLIKQLPDVTKRTVRRDLDELLRKGEIVRVGQWNQVFYRIKI